MQTSDECRRLARAHQYRSISPRSLLALCAGGLGVVGVIAITGSAMGRNEQQLADRIAGEHARLSVSHAASDHERAVFAGRQARFERRFVARATYTAVSQAPQAGH